MYAVDAVPGLGAPARLPAITHSKDLSDHYWKLCRTREEADALAALIRGRGHGWHVTVVPGATGFFNSHETLYPN